MSRKPAFLPTIFHGDDEYYKRDFHEYYWAIIPLVPPNTRVLDIGCGAGGLSFYLKQMKGCDVLGVDISDEALIACGKKGVRALKIDVEKEEIPGLYDVILSAVLEHLVDPLYVLKNLRKNLNEHGCIIVGIPNSSYFTARFAFLLGKNIKRFGNREVDYRLGIQPYDHINFFNKPTIELVLIKAGYQPSEWKYFRSDFRSKKLFIINYCANLLLNTFPNVFAEFIAVKATIIK